MKFHELDFKDHPSPFFGGVQAVHTFPNGYGVSVVCGPNSYGGNDGLFELAVLKNGAICYDSGITEDVLGHLDEQGVEKYLAEVESLNKAEG